jgi:hypothetical protein
MRILLRPAAVLLVMAATMTAQEYSWQQPHIDMLDNGDMRWRPEPYRFQAGDTVRYIDYDNGDDANSGASPAQAWQHHPWDHHASGQAAAASGPITYVFKGGVAYRGQLEADESGQADDPIRLVRDPDWGEGPAWFWGSTTLPQQWVRASHVQAPERLPEPAQVWALDLSQTGIEFGKKGVTFTAPNLHPNGELRRNTKDPTYTGVFLVEGSGQFRALHLARTPDWQPMGANFAMDYWHNTDAEVEGKNAAGKRIAGGFSDDIWAGKGLPVDYFTGGYIWMGYRSLMGTPTPSEIKAEVGNKKKGMVPFFDPETGALLKWAAPYGHGKGGLPYMIENLPQFLDAADEFYLDLEQQVLYLRLEDGVDPNKRQVEFVDNRGTIQIHGQHHIELAGLGFAFTQGDVIDLQNDVKDVDIHHCVFRNILDTGIKGAQDLRAGFFAVMDDIRIADCEFTEIGTHAISIRGADSKWGKREGYEDNLRGNLKRVDVLRNRTHNTGIRHRSSRWSNVHAISVHGLEQGEFAGNVIRRSFGSGLVVFGGKEGNLGALQTRQYEEPHMRIFVHHNKTEDTALGVNDYGGLALWQGGPTYAYCNNIGNSPGHMPAGLFGGTRPLNLSYPLYLDGAFKQYCFNNIIWGRTTDKKDPYANTTPGYFMVFGFLNHFTNNTLYRQSEGIGGSSGNRNDIVSNIFAEIDDKFLASNRIGDPSLAGGGDDAGSGLRGVPTLAYSRNIFHGPAEAGYLIREKEMERMPGIDKMIDAKNIADMAEQMCEFPLRVPDLGQHVDDMPIIGAPAGEPITELNESISFHPKADSPAIDQGGVYFMPFSLYGTVGEWGFAVNQTDPGLVVDYHWYMGGSHFDRMMYEQIPSYDLELNNPDADAFIAGPSEDWIDSALTFDGQRFGRVADDFMRSDLELRIPLGDGDIPLPPWQVKDTGEKVQKGRSKTELFELRYPAELRKTLIITTENLLLEAWFQAAGSGVIADKHDGTSGYQLLVGDTGQAEFRIASGGQTATVQTQQKVTGSQWQHVLAEIDRASGQMAIYLNGKLAGQAQAGLSAEASLDCRADFLVGEGFTGAIDFLRVCRGTLADADTDIDELYEWQTNGPFRYDFFGKPPVGRRDAGAIEYRE